MAGSSSVFSQLCFCLFVLSVWTTSHANDPFEGNFPTLKCFKERIVTGCGNETYWDVYERTNYSKWDQNINRAETHLLLFTRSNIKCPEFLHKCGGRLPTNTNFRFGKKTIFIVGGYISDPCDLAYFLEMTYQLLYREDCNVIVIRWTWGNFPDIYAAFKNAPVVGRQIAYFCVLLMERYGVSENTFYCIGHSVGAQVIGYAGRFFILFSGGKKMRMLIGLDPANAAYTEAGTEDNLDMSDGQWVQSIHTNAGDCFPKTIGLNRSLCHANFYINGGTIQPSCYISQFQGFLKGDWFKSFASFYPPLCCHFEVNQYFIASINPCGCYPIGVKCKDYPSFKSGLCSYCGEDGSRCAVLGMDFENCPHNGNESNIYFMDTDLKCPYFNNTNIDQGGFQCEALSSSPSRCFVPGQLRSNEECSLFVTL